MRFTDYLFYTLQKNNFLFLERLLYYYFMVCIYRACPAFVWFFDLFLLPPFLHANAILSAFDH